MLLTQTLPLIPAWRIAEGIQIIADETAPLEQVNDNFFIFRRYLQRYWLPKADIISVARSPWRTNNIAEACNRHLLAELGGVHPSFYTFICKYSSILVKQLIIFKLYVQNRSIKKIILIVEIIASILDFSII